MQLKKKYQKCFFNIGLLLLVVFFITFSKKISDAYGPASHYKIAEQILNYYFIGEFENWEKSLIMDGAITEDMPGFEDLCYLDNYAARYGFKSRYFNHFYDFQHGDINGGGLDYFLCLEGYCNSAKDWALSSTKQAEWAAEMQSSCEYNLEYVDDFSFDTNVNRYNSEQGTSLYGLGHVVHLLEDLTVPEHVRNDVHIFDKPYEKYFSDEGNMKFYMDNNGNLKTNGTIQEYLFYNKPMKYFNYANRDKFFDELSHYTQTFFFSSDTIESSYYTYENEDFDIVPSCIGAQVGDKKPKIIKEETKTINGDKYKFAYGKDENCNEFPLAVKKYLRYGVWEYRWSVEDTNVMEEYWKRLVVKAGQYGAGLIQLFLDLDGKIPSTTISDDFEDGVIDTSKWVVGGRIFNAFGGSAWNYENLEVLDSTDGYLSNHVWGPVSGLTYGAEAWVRTTYDFNDGQYHTINFRWEPAFPGYDYHVNIYYIQITDGYLIPLSDHSLFWQQLDYPGTSHLLWDTDSTWKGWVMEDELSPGKLNWSITIGPTGVACLYKGPDATGSSHCESLNSSYPWYIRFMVSDGTSAGFPAGDARLTLYDFSASVVSKEVIYQTDFSTNPSWTTDQPSNFYWDNTSQSYYMRAENNWPGYSPSRYFYKQLNWNFGSFQLEWDINISRVDWSASIDVGLYDSYFEGPFRYNLGQGIHVDYSNVDRGRALSLYVCGIGDCTATSTPGGAYSTNVWYTNTLTYDKSSNTVTLKIINRDTLATVWSTSLSVAGGGFSNPLNYLGGSNSAKSVGGVYTGVNRWAVAEGNIDNVVLKR